jgi:hypothetical protein
MTARADIETVGALRRMILTRQLDRRLIGLIRRV